MDNTLAEPAETVAPVPGRLASGARSPWWSVRRRPLALLSAVAVGAVTASFGVAPAALADENYPSWTDVEAAKQNEETKQAEIDTITALLGALQGTAADSATQSQIAAEAYLITRDELDTATTRAGTLAAQVTVAEATAATSRMRAGLIAAHLAKTGAQSLSLNLFVNGNTADTLLSQLGTASKLSEQSAQIFDEATQDANAAESLGEQAASAAKARERLTEESEARFDEASAAAEATQQAFDTEQRKSTELFEQLALLKDTTVEAEREYQTGQNAAAAAAAFERAQAAAAILVSRDTGTTGRSAATGTSGTSGTTETAGTSSSGRASAGSAAAPAESVPAAQSPAAQASAARAPAAQSPASQAQASAGPVAQTPASQAPPVSVPAAPAPVVSAPVAQAPAVRAPVVQAPAAPAAAAAAAPAPAAVASPNASAVSTALSFARSQLGDRYQLGGAGPDIWDCSGLTKAAYAAAGIYIGTHSATNQYNTMAARGKLVSFANVQVGDLLFWGSRGNYYHVAIYVGNGQILEAPNPSARVRVHSIWSIGQVAPYVGRPSA